MTDIELKRWFNDLDNTKKLAVIRNGYDRKVNEYIHLLESKIEKLKEEETEETDSTIDDEDILNQEIILANYDKKYEENGCNYVCIEGYIGIIHRQTKLLDLEEVYNMVIYQTNIKDFKNSISFFINIYKSNQFKYIFNPRSGKNILFMEISSITFLRPIIKIVTDILKYEDERKIENDQLKTFKMLNIGIDKLIVKHEDMAYIIKNIEHDRTLIKREEPEEQKEKEEETILISAITGKPKRKYTKKI